MTDQATNPLDTLSPEATDDTAPQGQDQPTAPTTPEVQPESQGQMGAAGLYDLSTVPQQYRSHVERIAKDIDRNVNAKLQEAAEYRKGWEPYQEVGLQDYDPEGVGALLQFAQSLSDPETAREALTNLAATLEIDLTTPAEVQDDDPVADLRSQLDDLRSQWDSREEEQTLSRYQAEAAEQYQREFGEVEAKNGKPFSTEEKERLIALAKRFQADSDEPIKAAYDLINQIAGKAETALVNRQPRQPVKAEPAGRASVAVKPVDNFEDALRLHTERNGKRTINA